MRKYIGLILVVSMLLAATGMTAFADGAFIVRESFDGYITNTAPQTVADGIGARVVETKAGANKAFYAETDINEGVLLEFDAEPSGDSFVIMADVRMEGDRADGNIVLNFDTPFNAVTLSGGELFVEGGKSIGGLNRNITNNIAIVVDAKMNRYSVYVNRKRLIGGWYSSTNFSNMKSFSFNFAIDTEGSAKIYIDNVYCYEGTQLYKANQLPKAKYNAEAAEYIENAAKEEARTIIKNHDFEDGTYSGALPTPKNNLIVPGEFAGRKAIKFAQTCSDDFFVESTFSTTENRIVASIDMYIDAGTPDIMMFTTKTAKNASSTVMRLQGTTLKNDADGKVLGTIPAKKWVNIAAAFNYTRKIYDLYIDGELVAKKLSIKNTALAELPTMYRVQLLGSTVENTVYADNFMVYTGRTPLTEEEKAGATGSTGVAKSVLVDEQYCIDLLEGSVAFNTHGKYMFANGKRTKTDVTAYLNENGEAMVPFKIVCEALGVEFSEETAMVNGKALTKKEVKDGITYVNGKELSDALSKGYTQYMRGLVVVGKTIENGQVYPEVEKNDAEGSSANIYVLDELSGYLLFDRPTAADLVEIFKSRFPDECPPVYVTRERLEEIRSQYLGGGRLKEMIDNEFIPKADSWLASPVLPKYGTYDGLRWLDEARVVMNNSLLLSITYIATEEEKYFNGLRKLILYPCDFPDWNQGRHYLDPSECAFGVAIAYSWFYDKWTEKERNTIEKALFEKTLLHLENTYDGIAERWSNCATPAWERLEGNWTSVCGGGNSVALMALMHKYPEVCATLLEKILHSFEYVLKALFPDGGYKEGSDLYWSLMMLYQHRAIASLDAVFGTDFGLTESPGFSDTWKFPLSMVNNMGIYNNYSDAAGLAPKTVAVGENLAWFAKKLNKPEIGKVRFNLIDSGADTSGYTWTDALFYDEAYETASLDVLPLDFQFLGREVQAMSMRKDYTDKSGAMIAAHAMGAIGNDHSHLDGGTYVLDMSGFRVASDLGMENYNLPGMFNYTSSRNYYYRQRPEGHNVPIINPDAMYFGQDYGTYSVIEKLESKAKGAISVSNLSDTYATKAEEVRRGYMLTDDRNSITVRDEFVLKGDVDENIVYSMIHTSGEVEIVDNSTVIVKGENGRKVQLQFITNADSWEIQDMDPKPLPLSPNPDGQNQNAGIRRITLIMKTKSKNLYSAVRYSPLDSYVSEMPFEDVKIDDWKIPDGEIIPMPEAEKIYLDGKLLEGFDPNKGSTTVKLKNGDPVPQITAEAGARRTEISSSKYEATVKVYSEQNPDMYRSYLIKFDYIDFAENPILSEADTASMTKHKLSLSDVSIIPEPANGPENTLDGGLDTRWAANKPGSWIKYDLGGLKTISAVGISTMLSDQRQTILDIEVSENGTDWIQVYTGKTPFGEGICYYAVNDRKARYIRIVGYGNTSATSSAWTSITEVEAYGK